MEANVGNNRAFSLGTGSLLIISAILSEVFMGRRKKYLMFFFSAVACSILDVQSVNAVDALYLTGIVQTINAHSGIVIVDVKSEGCCGIRNFRVYDVSTLGDIKGKTISFFIDSSTCRGGKIYEMRNIALLTGGRP